VGPALLGPDGPQPVKDRFPQPLVWRPGPHAVGDGWRAVPWVAGAAMLFAPGRPRLRFDERLFMYVEDQELCYRVWRDGGRVALAERAVVVHAGGTATAERWSRRSITARTLGNRARMVRWHAGWRGVGRFVRKDLGPRATRRAPGRG
jgi:GT2 family glycosyltransferase